MPVLPSASTAACRVPVRALHRPWPAQGAGEAAARSLAVERVGCLVPRTCIDGAVFAVFARAAYLACGDLLLTLAAPPLGDGPATLVLGSDAPDDLRILLRRGEPITSRAGRIHARHATFDLALARTWRAPEPRPPLASCDTHARVELARARLAQARDVRSSVLTGAAAAAALELERNCRDLDRAGALDAAALLVGRGEGLTPAGDDFLVGLCAALQALSPGDSAKLAFVGCLQSWLATQRSRTTPIAAHFLGLAARGHFSAGILRAIDALRSESDPRTAQHVFDATLQLGATSGADTLTGILAGLRAWTDPPVQEDPS
jgi:hypothetical protein